jgi:hypothetical protein
MFNYENSQYPLRSSYYFFTDLEVADNLRQSITPSSYDFLNDVSEVINQEVQRLAALSDGSKLSIVSDPVLVD